MSSKDLPEDSFQFRMPGFSGTVIPAGLILLNFILKIIFLDHRDIALDEPFTIFHAQGDLKDLFEMLKTENNPPLFFILLHFWIKVFGISAFSVRFLPMIFSILTAPVIYLLGKRFFSFRTGLIAALIYTFSNYHLLFAHEARVYSLFGLLTVTSMYFFLQLSYRSDTRTKVFFIIANILLIYSHFFGFYVLFIQFVSCLLIKNLRTRILGMYMITLVVVFIAYLPYLSVFISRFVLTSGHGTWVPRPVFSDLYKMVWKFSNVPVTTVFFLFLLFSAFIFYTFQYFQNKKTVSGMTAVILTWFFLPYLLMFILSFRIPMFLDRYLVFISFGYYFLIALSISHISSRKWIFYVLSLISVILMAATFNPDADNKRRMKEVVETVHKLKSEGSVVLICPSWLDLGFTYYYNQEYFRDPKNIKENLNRENILPLNDISQLDTARLPRASNVIYFEEWATLVDKENRICEYLRSRFRTEESYKIYESFTIYNFTP